VPVEGRRWLAETLPVSPETGRVAFAGG